MKNPVKIYCLVIGILAASTSLVVVVSAAGGDCYQYASCDSCTFHSGCGWDGNLQKCKAGGAMGPSNGGPRPSKWEWEPSQCQSSNHNNGPSDHHYCSRHEHCGNCVTEMGGTFHYLCGWDAAIMKCLRGNATGPENPSVNTANGAEWIYANSADCPSIGADCSLQKNCKACTESPSGECGWNAVSQTCEAGSASGPAHGGTGSDGGGTLPSGTWKWTADTCLNSEAICAKHGSCQNCTQELLTQCGWNGAKCLHGTHAGPDNATVATNIWAFTAEVCNYMQYSTAACQTELIQCSQRSSCQTCVGAFKEDDLQTDQIGCYWNVNDNKCYTKAGSQALSWSSWSVNFITPGHPDQCFSDDANCDSWGTDCQGCTTDSSGRCGFDGVLRQCMQGTESGPVRGHTKMWAWKSTHCPAEPKKCSDLLSCSSCQMSHTFSGYEESCRWHLGTYGWTCADADPYESSPPSCSSLTRDCESEGSIGCGFCTELLGCGWDWNSQKCRSGTLYGPMNGDLPPQWDWTIDQCSASTNCGGQCETAKSCNACAGSLNCGWDTNNQVCRPGSYRGPAHPTGSNNAPGVINGISSYEWSFGYAACSDSSCSLHEGCWNCVKEDGCGWTGSMCVRGDTSGPYQHIYSIGGGDDSTMWAHGSTSTCPSTWSFHWSPKSISMWLVFGLPILIVAMCATCWVKGRRKRAQLRAASANAPLLGAGGGTAVTGTVAGAAAAGTTTTGAGPALYPYGTASYSTNPGAAGATASTTSPGSPRDPFSNAGAVNAADSVPIMEEIA